MNLIIAIGNYLPLVFAAQQYVRYLVYRGKYVVREDNGSTADSHFRGSTGHFYHSHLHCSFVRFSAVT
jgi:hypothetical protein